METGLDCPETPAEGVMQGEEEPQFDHELSSQILFLRALLTLHTLLAASSQLGSYIREFTLYLPNDSLMDALDEADIDHKRPLSAEQQLREIETLSQINTLFPLVAHHLMNLRKLSLVSYSCRPTPFAQPSILAKGSVQKVSRGPFRMDWDALPLSVREGIKKMYESEHLSCMELRGVVLPPRMVFRGHYGLGYTCGGTMSSGLRELTLVAHCPMELEHLDDIEASEPCFCPDPLPSPTPSPPTPLSLARPVAPPTPVLTTIRLGYCGTVFLRYITTVYSDAFTSLKDLKLNVIERDLGICQWFLGVPSQQTSPDISPQISPPESHQVTASGGPILESFDCTIRCNTAHSSFNSRGLHALDFSGPACERLGITHRIWSVTNGSVDHTFAPSEEAG
ncbi:hypothetical protein DFP72DRAFT_1084657 [Ephemerocybe angulata]|uniref:Uncharacterized protein n=1 Tax=Ephemerocybe angulata TaxID=980116 RepID=A0A8H6H7Y9_9AGAR|nr:hypothetical protein DFP72DRAFT_1084657 [Tulosesus angulatus]